MKNKLKIAYVSWCAVITSAVFAANAENIKFDGYEAIGRPWGRGACTPRWRSGTTIFEGCNGGTPNCVMVQTYMPKCSGSGNSNCPDPMYVEVGSASCTYTNANYGDCACRAI